METKIFSAYKAKKLNYQTKADLFIIDMINKGYTTLYNIDFRKNKNLKNEYKNIIDVRYYTKNWTVRKCILIK